jgi:hypothetical protein
MQLDYLCEWKPEDPTQSLHRTVSQPGLILTLQVKWVPLRLGNGTAFKDFVVDLRAIEGRILAQRNRPETRASKEVAMTGTIPV